MNSNIKERQKDIGMEIRLEGQQESDNTAVNIIDEKQKDGNSGISIEEQEESDENLEELLVKDQAGNALKKEPFHLPKTLTAGTETYPVEYRQGVWKVMVPANCKTLQITVPDQKENEELSFTKWGGYLTESEKNRTGALSIYNKF